MPIKVNKLVLWRCHRGDPKLSGKLVIYTHPSIHLASYIMVAISSSSLVNHLFVLSVDCISLYDFPENE